VPVRLPLADFVDAAAGRLAAGAALQRPGDAMAHAAAQTVEAGSLCCSRALWLRQLWGRSYGAAGVGVPTGSLRLA
jgi:hypothetical protein